MTYFDHYLAEDMSMYNDQLHSLMDAANKLYYLAMTADFYGKETELQEITQAMKVLEALNNKKNKRDADQFDAEARLNWF